MEFNRHRVVGEGASAKVYTGSLPSGGEVAVERFERADGIASLRNPFTTEFATMVGSLWHKNLIQLHGWCCEGNNLVLVYKYMPNGSLNKVLHKSFNSAIVPSWKHN
ncbi:L-type lectin-domain containing receptor kinase S.6-like [Pyrus ussuriensis x Pyrus communis]|uniref:L-type lectin-domain containing receptor kinase S.6-like n=1 Tax=Pyrus ussuriensis x Pyrus communis TaxID=2448454 RepID=A0A5N5FKC1_9ROSA|nr:L-type lectin-domain containing receptor kinase S.6-like [Pyrus ussuriensis x Pyrus communis]